MCSRTVKMAVNQVMVGLSFVYTNVRHLRNNKKVVNMDCFLKCKWMQQYFDTCSFIIMWFLFGHLFISPTQFHLCPKHMNFSMSNIAKSCHSANTKSFGHLTNFKRKKRFTLDTRRTCCPYAARPIDGTTLVGANCSTYTGSDGWFAMFNWYFGPRTACKRCKVVWKKLKGRVR